MIERIIADEAWQELAKLQEKLDAITLTIEKIEKSMLNINDLSLPVFPEKS